MVLYFISILFSSFRAPQLPHPHPLLPSNTHNSWLYKLLRHVFNIYAVSDLQFILILGTRMCTSYTRTTYLDTYVYMYIRIYRVLED